MKMTLLKILIPTLLMQAVTFATIANEEKSGASIYAAAGSGLGLGSFRFGYNTWEAGLLNNQFVGLDKILFSGSTYASFGLGATIAPTLAPGFFAAIGFDWTMFWGIGIRGELNACGSTSGQSIAQLLFGMSFRF